MSKKVGWGILGSPRVALSTLAALTTLLLLSSPATASHTTIGPDGVSIDAAGKRILYIARDGEFNSITVSETDTSYVFTEANASIPPVASDGGCVVDLGVATCPKAGIDSITVFGAAETGDLATTHDRIVVNAKPPKGTTIDGGAGNDDIVGSQGDDVIFGREGIDLITARAGNDSVISGPTAASPARSQSVDGGAGFDEVRYDDRTEGGIAINLGTGQAISRDFDVTSCPPAPPANPTGGCLVDNLQGQSSEKFVGTDFGDEMYGGSLAQTFVGGDGGDTICGGMGVDTVDYSDHSQGINVSLDGNPAMPTDFRHALPVFPPGLDEYRKARVDCRETDPASPLGEPIPVGGMRDCVANDGAPGENDCVGEDIENIVGGDGNDTLVGNSPDELEGLGPKVEPHGINLIQGRGGDDLIDGRFGSDALSGGDGTDTVTYASRPQPVSAAIDGAANDGTKIDGATLEAVRFGDFDFRSNLSDSIEGDVENIIGGSNDDVLKGDGDANVLQGGVGADLLDGGGGGDQLEGGTENDTIAGGDGSDTVLGGAGDDVLDGEAGDDNVQGGAGGDRVSGGPGADTLSGGDDASEDTVDYSDATTPVHVSADNVSGDGRTGEGDNVVADFEVIVGGIDDDVLAGGPGSELIMGGDGDDLLSGGPGADDLSGGSGSDAASYATAGGNVYVNLAEAGNDGESGEGDYVLEDVEEVHGGPGDDTLVGDGKANVLLGRSGDDRLAGAEGDDLLVGGLGNDALSGDVGDDTLFGSDGNDSLSGADGNDDLKGEAGDDTLDGGAGNDRHVGGPNVDTILYSSRSAGVTVTLDGKDKNGQSNENDFINNDVENVTTGSGPDAIDSDDNKRSEVRCGAGTDVVTADPDDRINGDCENVQVSALGTRCSASTGKVTMAKSGAIPVRVFCAIDAKGTLRLQSVTRVRTSKGRPRRVLKLGSRSFSLKAGQRRTVTVKVSKGARRYIQRKKRLSVRARISAKAQGKSRTLKSSSVFTVRGR